MLGVVGTSTRIVRLGQEVIRMLVCSSRIFMDDGGGGGVGRDLGREGRYTWENLGI